MDSGSFLATQKSCCIAHIHCNQNKVISANSHLNQGRTVAFLLPVLYQVVWSPEYLIRVWGRKGWEALLRPTRNVMLPTSPFFDSS